jgi:sugar lactone lactonase YvrE
MTGQGYVYDVGTGASLASFQFATGPDPTFVNDVVVTRTAAWFTDSFRPVLYRVAIAPDGTLGSFTTLSLSGDFVFVPGEFNTNGIDATPDGGTLVIVQSNARQLFTVDPETGVADLIELSGGDVRFGDGILLDGETLYVVQNRLHRVAVVALSDELASGTIVGHLTHSAFQVPTTIAEHGDRLYAVNARFGVANPETQSFSVVQVGKEG